jgi:hypothetical protein
MFRPMSHWSFLLFSPPLSASRKRKFPFHEEILKCPSAVCTLFSISDMNNEINQSCNGEISHPNQLLPIFDPIKPKELIGNLEIISRYNYPYSLLNYSNKTKYNAVETMRDHEINFHH